MELLIQVLMLFIVLNYALKLSFWKWWAAGLFGLLCAVFVVVAYPYAIEQSRTQLADYLTNTKVMQDVAVLITIESAACLLFCFSAIRSLYTKKKKRPIPVLYKYLNILIFPVLFYLLAQIIFAFPGVHFNTIACLFAGMVFLLLPALSYSVKRFYPDSEQRLELHFLVSLLVAVLGLLTTVNGQVVYAATREPTNYLALFLSFGLLLVLFGFGYLWSKLRIKN